MSIPTARWAVALPAAASLLLVAGAAPAFATDHDTYTVELRQQLSRTATTQDGGAPQEGNCPGIPADKDGWHFVLPGNDSHFVKLTVTFEPGGQQIVTDFGPPSDKHAYVASEAGATLTSVNAEIKGGDLKKFNLSHTCPAGVTTPDVPVENPGGDDKPGEMPSESASDKPGDKPSESASDNPTSDASASAAPAPSGNGGGDLAETGNGAPVGMLAAAAAALVAGGGYLVARRRSARRH